MAEGSTATPAAPAEEKAATPAEEAAAAALARAQRPPASLGGPEPEPEEDENGDGHESEQQRRSRLAELAKQPRPDLETEVDDEYAEARDAVAYGSTDPDDLQDATEWLLSDTADVITRRLRVRVGGSDEEPTKIAWVIRAIGIDVIRSAEREATGNRQQRRAAGGERYDELKANLRVIVEGTVQPDLKEAAQQKGLRDAATLLQRRLAFRPGVIAQLAGEIMSLSGFDPEDVAAAGN